MAHRLVQRPREDLAQALALERILQARIEGIDVGRQLALAPQVVPDVFIRGEDVLRLELQMLRERAQEEGCLLFAHAVVDALIGEQARVVPDRLAVLAPEAGERPARQLLAWIPFALPVVEKSFRRVTLFQSSQ